MACRVTIWHGDTHALPSISLRCCSVERFLKYKRKLILSQGNIKLYENGRKYVEKKSVEDIKKTYKTIAKKVNHLSVGWVVWAVFIWFLISTSCDVDTIKPYKKMLQQHTQDIFWNNLPVLGLWNSCICNCVCFCVIYYASSVMICNGFALVTNDWLRFLSRTGGKNFNFFQVCTLCSSKDHGRQGF